MGSHIALSIKKLERELNLNPKAIKPITIAIADGYKLQSARKVGLCWLMRNTSFTFELQLLRMGGYDLVLGMD